MTLSRKAIRPLQPAFLLTHNVLPVSIDYRLCPEINLIDGPIKDVCDAYAWVQTGLQAVVKAKGILVDEKRIVVIGWSTGGLLAMTTAWTSKEAGLRCPVAILSFYGPTDFESGGESVKSAFCSRSVATYTTDSRMLYASCLRFHSHIQRVQDCSIRMHFAFRSALHCELSQSPHLNHSISR